MKRLALIHHQNATRGVAFSPIGLRGIPNTPQALGLLRLASDILLVIRKLSDENANQPVIKLGDGFGPGLLETNKLSGLLKGTRKEVP